MFHDTLHKGKIKGEKRKMIGQGYVRHQDFRDLTEAEAKAFIVFLTMEVERHTEDIHKIEGDILEVRRIKHL